VPIEFIATSKLPTAFGEFNISVFQDPVSGEEHVALSKGLENPPTGPVLVRVHSECLTGDAFASLKCGLTNKIRAYALQDQGHDTVDANLLLNLPADARRYDMCSIMLDHLKVKEVKLITNNPLKIQALKDQGINVVGRVPLTVGRNPFNEQYLKTKRERMDHLYQKDDF